MHTIGKSLTQHPLWEKNLKREWCYEKNNTLGIMPDIISYGSGIKVWWRCPESHEWVATIANRIHGRGCPYCSGRKVIVGVNDLATIAPNVAIEWHPTKNGNLTPQDVKGQSRKVVWWTCSQDKTHEWTARVQHRVNGHGCPICSGRKALPGINDLETIYPDIAAEWHPVRNGILTPNDVKQGSNISVWWLGKCGHEWEASIRHRTQGHGCPYCSGRKVIVGVNDLATIAPNVAVEWHPTKNGKLQPQNVKWSSGKIVWWKCAKNHEWKSSINHRTSGGTNCPHCMLSHGERDIIQWAKANGYIVEQQWTHQDCKDKRPLPFDMMLYEEKQGELFEVALIEYDGEQHSNPDTFYSSKYCKNGETSYEYIVRHDKMKNDFCRDTGRLLIRVPYTIKGVESIGNYILDNLRNRRY